MRVVSQNGNVDLPYEKIDVCHATENVVALHNEKQYVLGSYSSQEKAYKAMEMLREQYSRIRIIKALASGTCEHMEKSLKPEEFKDILEEYISMEAFQFPQDNEIEV